MYGGQNRLGSIHRTPTGRPPYITAQCTTVSRVVPELSSAKKIPVLVFLVQLNLVHRKTPEISGAPASSCKFMHRIDLFDNMAAMTVCRQYSNCC